jgi:TolA-binding protein
MGLTCAALVSWTTSGDRLLAQEETVEATRQYGVAVRLQNLESYDLGAQAWVKFIQQYPKDPRIDKATHYLGVCYFQDGKLDQALSTFEKVVADYPNLDLLDASYLYLGVTQYNLAQAGKPELYDKAAQTLETLATKFPESKYIPDSLFYRGECFYMRQKGKEAVGLYQKLVDEHPKHRFRADALYALGVAQEELGEHDAAGKTYAAFLKEFPDHGLATEVGMRLGETLFAAGQYGPAVERFQAAAGVPGFEFADWATVRQADALAQTGKHAEAAALYASVPEKFPKSEHLDRAALAGGKCYYLAGDLAQARSQLSRLLDKEGEAAAEAAHWTAKSLLKENKPAEALAAVEKVLPKAGATPFAAQLLMDRADAVYEIPERRAESIALYAEIAQKHPNDAVVPQALYMAGFAALEKGQYDAAMKHATAFLAAHADHELAPDVMHVAAESQLLMNQHADAEKRYAELIGKYPNRPDADLWKVRRALALQLQKKHAETVAALGPVVGQLRDAALIAEAQYLIGTSQVAQGEYEQSAKSLEASLAAAPEWRQADETRLALAQAYRNLDQLDQAKSTVTSLTKDFPQSQILDKAYYRLGEYNYVSGGYQAAAEAYQKVVDSWPKSPLVPHALHELGCSRLNEGAADAAEQALSRLIEQYPDHALIPRARYARGMSRYQLKKYDPAVEDLQAMLASGPTGQEKSDAQYLLALCQMDTGKHDQAAATFRSLLEEDPQYAGADNARYQLAWALKLQGKQDEAVEAFAKFAEDFPSSARAPEAHYHVGEAAYDRKDYAAAATAYYTAMQQAGKSELGEKAAHKLAWSYYHQDNFDSAQKTFSYQRKTFPDGPLGADAVFMEAECLFRQEKYEEALAAYDQVQGLQNKDFQVLALLHAGQAAGQLEQWQKSLELVTKCVEQFPESPYADEALYQQGWAQQKLGKTDEALALYEKVIAAAGGGASESAARAQFMIGEIQFERKVHDEAVKSFFKVIYGYSFPKWQAEATYEAARCFEVLKKPSQAVKLYQELVQKYPDSDKVPLAKQRIENLKG